MLDRTVFRGVATDPPPDQLGENALYSKNMLPGSATSVRPRPGSSLIQRFSPVDNFRYIYATPLPDDANYTVLLSVVNGPTITPETHTEAIFRSHPGKTVYDALVTLGTPFLVKKIASVALGTQIPTGCQFGNKFFICFPDQRPLVIQPKSGGMLKAYWCGIQPPTGGPAIGASIYPAINMDDYEGQVIQVAYSYFSSARNIFSQPSPVGAYTVVRTGGVIYRPTINGFLPPRNTTSNNDNGYDGDIDYIAVGIQSSTNAGLMVVYPDCFIPVTFAAGGAFIGTPSLLFDIAPNILNLGFDLNKLSGALYVPPSVRYCERYKERIWLAGQRDVIRFSALTTLQILPSQTRGLVSITAGAAAMTGDADTRFTQDYVVGDVLSINGSNGVIFVVTVITDDDHMTVNYNSPSTFANFQIWRLWRGAPLARLRLTPTETWSVSQLYYSLYADGKYVGEISDVIDDTDFAYLDRDYVLTVTAQFELVGHNDRIWPSGYDANTPGNAPTTFPEATQLLDDFLLTESLDQGERMSGLISAKEALFIAFQNSFTRLTLAQDEGGVPEPDIRPYYGHSGCIAPRSLCKTPGGDIGWIGNDGIFFDSANGPVNLLSELQSLTLIRGGQWISSADLPNMVMGFSRRWNGFVIGNFTLNGLANQWGVLTTAPQPGIFLFDGHSVTSNLLTHLDGNGNERILAGDNQGRVKELLDSTTLNDLGLTDDSLAAYLCEWNEGWNGKPNGSTWNIARMRVPGMVCPFSAELELTLIVRRFNFLEREFTRLPASATVELALREREFLPGADIPVQQNESRFVSIGFRYFSPTGSYSGGSPVLGRPMELTHYVGFERTDA